MDETSDLPSTSTSSSSAASRVFAVAELLEQILLHLPQKDILTSQTITPSWLYTIKGSSKLQRRLFLLPQQPQNTPSSKSKPTGSKHDPPPTPDKKHITVTTFLGSIQIPHPLHAASSALTPNNTTTTTTPEICINPLLPSIPTLPAGHWSITANTFSPTSAFPSPAWLPIPDPLLYDIYRAQTPTLEYDAPIPRLPPSDPDTSTSSTPREPPSAGTTQHYSPPTLPPPHSWRAMYTSQPPATQLRLSLVHEHVVLSFRSKKMVHSARAYRSRMLTAADGVKMGAVVDAAETLLAEEWGERTREGPKMWASREHVWIVEAVVASADTGPPCRCRDRERWDGGGRGVFWRDAGDEEW
ncbi:hypothetical protein EJ05DRAFT_479725 [Pseudovirgaria hyperparasitica]|uniref:F-box domain-containing protein n=1 Tax=Pseudovirgaria hyperparasitica TaxID=470096 RepID=A0A6A6VUE0_9PEZI|nr:uncharacterized protein EJ05DRAFT_479725 [Pseudovirgaria hyperparasitica]KAF2754192.1 hypothetical protein EJ05DRAFT_479725 [Pseudovirgaria hyperparasitica]